MPTEITIKSANPTSITPTVTPPSSLTTSPTVLDTAAPVASPVEETTSSPVANPTTVPPPPSTSVVVGKDDSRLIAYLGNWQSCPTMSDVEHYTHIVIAFAVSYTWAPSKNICSTTCEIAEPLICNNSPNPSLVSQWQAAGKKVILSFGGE